MASDVGAVEDEDDHGPKDRENIKTNYAHKASEARRVDRPRSAAKEQLERAGQRIFLDGEKENRRSRSRSAPGKRVVSDAHWRKNRSPPQKSTSPKSTRNSTPRRRIHDDGVKIKPVSEPRQTAGRKHSGGRQLPTRHDQSPQDDGIRVYSTPPSSKKHSEDRKKNSEDIDGGGHRDKETGRSESASPQSKDPPEKRQKARTSQQPDSSTVKSPVRTPQTRRRTVSPETLSLRSTSGYIGEEKASTKSHKGNILSHVFGESKRIFSKQPPVPITSPRVPSIEAWLNETPDPFVDGEEQPVDIISPLRSKSRSQRSEDLMQKLPDNNPEILPEPEAKPEPDSEGARVSVEDPNKIWEALDSKDGTRRHVPGSRKKKRVRSSALQEDNPFPAEFDPGARVDSSVNGSASASKMVDLTHDTPDLSPSASSVRRRGAKRSTLSPTRNRQRSDPPINASQDDVQSPVNSTASDPRAKFTPPASSLRPPGITAKRPFPSTGQHRLSTIASVETFNSKAQHAAPSISEATELRRYLQLVRTRRFRKKPGISLTPTL